MKLYLFDYDDYLYSSAANRIKFVDTLAERDIVPIAIESFQDYMIIDFGAQSVPEQVINFCEDFWEADPELTLIVCGVDYRKAAMSLFEILDDIETIDEVAKDNDALYRRLVTHRVKDVHKYCEAEGVKVKFKGE